MSLDGAAGLTSREQGAEAAKAVIHAYGRGDIPEALRITEQAMAAGDPELLIVFVLWSLRVLGGQFRDWVVETGEKRALELLEVYLLDPDWDP